MQPVTLWSCRNQRGELEFNHLSDGHEPGPRPAPKHPNHIKAWAGGEWNFEHAWRDGRGVVMRGNEAFMSWCSAMECGSAPSTCRASSKESSPVRNYHEGQSMFQLITQTTVRLKRINLRQETHGKQKVSAVDLDFVLEGRNDILALLHPDLCEANYHDPDADAGQESVDGVPKAYHKRRFPKQGPITWDDETTGTDLTVIYGLGDDASNIDFTDGKTVVKRAELKEDGIALIFFRYSTSDIEDGALDKLRVKVEQLVDITLIQQEQLRQEAVIDGTTDAFKRDHPDAGDMFAAAHGGDGQDDGDGEDDDEGHDGDGEDDDEGPSADDTELSAEPAWPFPKNAPDESPPQSVTVEQSQPGTRTARGREKTQAALKAGATH